MRHQDQIKKLKYYLHQFQKTGEMNVSDKLATLIADLKSSKDHSIEKLVDDHGRDIIKKFVGTPQFKNPELAFQIFNQLLGLYLVEAASITTYIAGLKIQLEFYYRHKRIDLDLLALFSNKIQNHPNPSRDLLKHSTSVGIIERLINFSPNVDDVNLFSRVYELISQFDIPTPFSVFHMLKALVIAYLKNPDFEFNYDFFKKLILQLIPHKEEVAALDTESTKKNILHLFIEQGNPEKDFYGRILFALCSFSDINRASASGSTPLIVAARMGNSRACAVLIDRGADIFCENGNGETAMLLAIRRRDVKLREVLTSSAAKMQSANTSGTSLSSAVFRYKSYAEIKNLLIQGFNPNQYSLELTPTHFACYQAKKDPARAEIYELILAYGGDPRKLTRNKSPSDAEQYAQWKVQDKKLKAESKKRELEKPDLAEKEDQQEVKVRKAPKKKSKNYLSELKPDELTKEESDFAAEAITAELLEAHADELLQLKPLQLQAMQNLANELRAGHTTGYFAWPTGMGKTVAAIAIIKSLQWPTLIIVPSLVLVDQFICRINQFYPNQEIGIIDGAKKEVKPITITTYQSLLKIVTEDKWLSQQFKLVIADEAHHALANGFKLDVLRFFKNALVYGFTATPEYNGSRTAGSLRDLSENFKHCISQYSIRECIEQGYLASCQAIQIKPEISSLESKQFRAGTIDIPTVRKLVTSYHHMIAHFYLHQTNPLTQTRLAGTQAIAFCGGIAHANAIAEDLNKLLRPYFANFPGQIAVAIHSEASDPRKILKDYKEGRILFLCGDKMVREGFDCPGINAVFNFPTSSELSFIQGAGRGLRGRFVSIIDIIFTQKKQILFRKILGENYILNESLAVQDIPSVQLIPLAQPEIQTEITGHLTYQIDWGTPKLELIEEMEIDEVETPPQLLQFPDSLDEFNFSPPGF